MSKESLCKLKLLADVVYIQSKSASTLTEVESGERSSAPYIPLQLFTLLAGGELTCRVAFKPLLSMCSSHLPAQLLLQTKLQRHSHYSGTSSLSLSQSWAWPLASYLLNLLQSIFFSISYSGPVLFSAGDSVQCGHFKSLPVALPPMKL